jgi:hypothetical protein
MRSRESPEKVVERPRRQETAHQKRLRVAQDKTIAAMWKQDDRDVHKSQSTLRPKWNEDDVQVSFPWLKEKDKVVKKKVPKTNISMERTSYDALPLPPPGCCSRNGRTLTRVWSEHHPMSHQEHEIILPCAWTDVRGFTTPFASTKRKRCGILTGRRWRICSIKWT